MGRPKKKKSFLLSIAFVATLAAAIYYHSRPTIVGYIGPFSGVNMMDGQEFFRGLNAGFQNDSYFSRFQIVSMDVNHSRKAAYIDVKRFLDKNKISFLWADFPKNRESDLNKSLEKFSGRTFSVDDFVPSDGEIAVVIGEFFKKELNSSRVHVFYSQGKKKLVEVLKLNLRSQSDGVRLTDLGIESLSTSDPLPIGTDTILILSDSKHGIQALDLLKIKSFSGRVVILNMDLYAEVFDTQKQWPRDLYAITIFDQDTVKRFRAQIPPHIEVTARSYIGFSLATRISKQKLENFAREKPLVFVRKVTSLRN